MSCIFLLFNLHFVFEAAILYIVSEAYFHNGRFINYHWYQCELVIIEKKMEVSTHLFIGIFIFCLFFKYTSISTSRLTSVTILTVKCCALCWDVIGFLFSSMGTLHEYSLCWCLCVYSITEGFSIYIFPYWKIYFPNAVMNVCYKLLDSYDLEVIQGIVSSLWRVR